MKPVHVFFIRGLSTYGHDHVRVGPIDFGPMYGKIGSALTARGIHFIPVTGLGSGPLSEVAARALAFITSHPVWRDTNDPVHILGHSAGGLAARLVLRALKGQDARIASVVTLATPNEGAELARICSVMPERYRGSALLLRTFGYDIATRKHFFDELTSESIRRLFREKCSDSRLASVIAHAPRSEWCAPLKAIYKIRAFNEFRIPSDGVVERDTQPIGQVIAELNLDHFRQIGLFDDGRRFHQMCDVLAQHFRTY